jgi:hypothetical protein
MAGAHWRRALVGRCCECFCTVMGGYRRNEISQPVRRHEVGVVEAVPVEIASEVTFMDSLETEGPGLAPRRAVEYGPARVPDGGAADFNGIIPAWEYPFSATPYHKSRSSRPNRTRTIEPGFQAAILRYSRSDRSETCSRRGSSRGHTSLCTDTVHPRF